MSIEHSKMYHKTILSFFLLTILVVSLIECADDAAAKKEAHMKKHKEAHEKMCSGDKEMGEKMFKGFQCFQAGVS